jgi:hypothetical protein
MYPVRLAFSEVLERIEALIANGHHAEALVTSMFTFEKLVKRILRRAIVARGFSLAHAETMLDRNGLEQLLEKWAVFERDHRTLPQILGNEWRPIPAAKKARNDLVHGNKVFKLEKCREQAESVLVALRKLHRVMSEDYGVDPWGKRPRERGGLPWNG